LYVNFISVQIFFPLRYNKSNFAVVLALAVTMRKRLRPTLFLSVLVLLASSYTSCELINPEEQIPSFLRIDSISFATASSEGKPIENFTDAWVYDNEQLVGVYELPAVVPVLRGGDANIRIRAGIKLNGQVGTRVPYIFSVDYLKTIELFPDSQLHINPTLFFKEGVTFDWLENFDNSSTTTLSKTSQSQAEVERITGVESYDGGSLKLALDADQLIFECKMTGDGVDIPGGGTPSFLEFTYKCNNSFVVGLFSEDPGGTRQNSIIILNPSEDWNHIYINLTDVVSANPNYTAQNPFFGFIRDENVEGEAFVILDNIRMMH